MQPQGVWARRNMHHIQHPTLGWSNPKQCPAIPRETAKTWCLILVHGGQWPRKIISEQLHNWQTPHLSETQKWNNSRFTSPLQLYQDTSKTVLTLEPQNDLLTALNVTSCSLSVSLYSINKDWKPVIFCLSTGANGNFVKGRKPPNCKVY